MKLLIALGGNALLQRGEPFEIETQRINIQRAVRSIVPLANDHQLIITHGNGPQVGMLAQQSEDAVDTPPYPLDVVGAESEGMIGYLLEQELRNQIRGVRVANIVTQTLVDPADPAFANPTKYIGRQYTADEAAGLEKSRHWTMRQEGTHWRRAVASPLPLEILQLDAITTLSDAGFVVICTGGGGVPVSKNPDGTFQGVEAVIDKDHASGLLAKRLYASALILLTDVDAVYRDWGTPGQQPVHQIALNDMEQEEFDPGSMGPKVTAGCHFVRETGCRAVIGALDQAEDLLKGRKGTTINPLL